MAQSSRCRSTSCYWLQYADHWVAPIRRSRTGSIMAIIAWRQYADHHVAPICRSVTEALIKHPGIADALIARHGDEAVGALNRISQQNAQRLGMSADEGLLSATQRSPELLGVIRKYGDPAMNFIWNNKGALTVGTLLAGFVADPEAYFSGIKSLVEPVAKRVIEPIVKQEQTTKPEEQESAFRDSHNN